VCVLLNELHVCFFFSILLQTHTNPCFLRKGGDEEQEMLKRDLRQILEEGDVFGLLPDQLFYTVTYGNAPVNGVKRSVAAVSACQLQNLNT
jgi:hypothetical protein